MAKPTLTTSCDVCGRPLPPRTAKRGRHRERHRECIVFLSRLRETQDLLNQMRFLPPTKRQGSNALLGHAKAVKSQLHELWRNMTVKSVKAATDDRDYYTGKSPRGA